MADRGGVKKKEAGKVHFLVSKLESRAGFGERPWGQSAVFSANTRGEREKSMGRSATKGEGGAGGTRRRRSGKWSSGWSFSGTKKTQPIGKTHGTEATKKNSKDYARNARMNPLSFKRAEKKCPRRASYFSAQEARFNFAVRKRGLQAQADLLRCSHSWKRGTVRLLRRSRTCRRLRFIWPLRSESAWPEIPVLQGLHYRVKATTSEWLELVEIEDQRGRPCAFPGQSIGSAPWQAGALLPRRFKSLLLLLRRRSLALAWGLEK